MTLLRTIQLFLILICFSPKTEASQQPTGQETQQLTVADHLTTARGASPEQKADQYLARLAEDEKARSAAYWNGRYWLSPLELAWMLGVTWLLMATGLSRRMRDLALRIAKRRALSTALYVAQYIVITAVLSFPITVYKDFFREHAFLLSNMSFGAWFGEWLIGLAVSMVLLSLLMVGIYAVIRRASKTWWIWGSGVSIVFLVIVMIIGPVFIAPLFNKYTPMAEGPLKDRILNLAHANQVPASEVYQFDASKQSKRVSANVSGFLGTMRISLNDNLINRCDEAEVAAVMSHEIGHYVLGHVYEMTVYFAIIVLIGFAFVRFALTKLLAWRGEKFGVRDVADVAGLPLLVAVFTVFMFAITPLLNNIIRSNEVEADLFGLNAADEPDAFAEIALKLAEYRKLDPGPVEEWFFYDHPSGKSRILMAMQYKAAMSKSSAKE